MIYAAIKQDKTAIKIVAEEDLWIPLFLEANH